MSTDLGLELLQDGEFEAAIQQFDRALATDQSADLYYYRGVAHDMNDETELAVADFDCALQADARHILALYSRSLVHRKHSNWEGAFQDLRQAFSLDPEDFRIANAYAQMLVKSPEEAHHNGPLAVQVASRACELTEWQDGLCIHTLAGAFDLVGEPEKAAEVRKLTVASFDFADIDDALMGYFAFQLRHRPEPDGLQEIVQASPVRVSIRTVKARHPDEESVIFSVGMSAQPMAVPPGVSINDEAFAEVLMRLPADWPLPPDLADEQESWPLLWLRQLAHYPHLTGEYLGTGLFPAPGQPLSPLAPNCPFSAFILVTNLTLEGFRTEAGHYINLITVVPITAKEHRLASEQGLSDLLERLVKEGYQPSLVPGRSCVA